MSGRLPLWVAVWTALACSGFAGLVNQVVWQRALKVFLGGSETLSAMVVVLVFLGGLGLGARLASGAGRLRSPLKALAAVELLLAALTAAIAVLLGLDLSESVYAVQRLALSSGLPLRAVYAVGATLLLLPPTLAMGATVPLASEAFQRQLGASDRQLVPVLFVVNTLGAAAGALGASLWLLPVLGQRVTLFLAVGCNAVAAVLVALAAAPTPAALPRHEPRSRGAVSWDDTLGFFLGVLALGYEMALFRLLALAHEPLPITFAVGLAGFLVAWSLGVFVAGRLPGFRSVPLWGALAAFVVAAVPRLYLLDLAEGWSLTRGLVVFSLPAVAFGVLYGNVVARAAKSWGRDVGRYAAANTLGSCVGVLGFTLVGHELPLEAGTTVLALGLGALATVELGRGPRLRALLATLATAQVVGLVAVCWWGLGVRSTELLGYRVYAGRDGVAEISEQGNVYLDGLWHTKLSDGQDHIGRPYSWLMAAAAVLAYDGRPERALVIGAGVGITSATLVGVEGLQVDGYEINHTLQRVLADYPDETLHAATHPRIDWRWQDARTGLALDETRYDIILSAPLHLKQAGSSLLLSTEYLRLLKSRLAPGGVVAVYSNEDNAAQTLLVRRTVADHFRYQVSWYDGVVTVASDTPIELTPDGLAARIAEPDPLYREVARLDGRLRASGEGGLLGWYEGPLTGPVADRPITDDQPLLEYPELADRYVRPVPLSELQPSSEM